MKHGNWLHQNRTCGNQFGRGYTKTALNRRDKEHEDRTKRAKDWICKHVLRHEHSKKTNKKAHTSDSRGHMVPKRYVLDKEGNLPPTEKRS
jgi:hypothetical protein